MATVSSPQVVRFGVFEVDLHSRELRKQGLKVKLQEQPFCILEILLRHPGELVMREELRQKIWSADTFVDFELGLNTAVNRLRQALGDSADNPRFVETLPRRGYRFIASVDRPMVAPDGATSPDASASAARPLDENASTGAVRQSRRQFRWVPVLAGVSLVSLVGLLVTLNVGGLRERMLGRVNVGRIESLAVLPFENLSGDKEQEYFADGMTDELITELGKIGALRVISRTSVMPYRAARKPLGEIAGKLNVDAVVEGTVLRSGNRVRITAQLIRAATEKHLWAESYEGELSDALALQAKVARAIAGEIRIRLTPEEQARLATARPVNPAAYEAYLKGRYFWSKRKEEDVSKSLEYFNQAIRLDPAYPLGYAGLADSYVLLGILGLRPPREVFPKARDAARRALELDETQAEAHTSLADIMEGYDWDWAAAEKEFKRAIDLNPSYSTAHQWYANLLSILGRRQEAIAEAKRARELDPLSYIMNGFVGFTYFKARRYREAVEEWHKAIELEPSLPLWHLWLARAYEQQHALSEAIAEDEKGVNLSGGSPSYVASLGYVYALSGDRTKALAMHRKLEEMSKSRYVSPLDIAIIYTGLGDKESALGWLEKAYQERTMRLTELPDAHFDSLRSDPRFQDLMRRIGLPPYQQAMN